MKYEIEDLIKKPFGRLKVLKEVKKNIFPCGARQRVLLCLCDCGIEKTVMLSDLISKKTKSCGCYKKERITKHGLSRTPEYLAVDRMNSVCYNIKNPHYATYGGRGIWVHNRWRYDNVLRYINFVDDMGIRPTSQHSNDRVDNNGNYEPENCRWATKKEQSRNTRRNRLVDYKGTLMCIAAICEKYGIKKSTLRDRLNKGWSVEKALTIPTQKYNHLNY